MSGLSKLTKALSVLFITPVMSISACELHDMPNFGVFGSFPAKLQPHLAKATPDYLEVRHLRRMAVESGESNTINVKYTLPMEYRDISIEFSPTEAVQVEGEPRISPTKIRGSHALNFVANQPGEHEIKVYIAAVKQGEPYTQEQSIAITAF